MNTLDEHYERLLPLLIGGRVIPLLGAGANRCGRTNGAWREGVDIPDGNELALLLEQGRGYPDGETPDLQRVSQFIAVKLGPGALYDILHEVFDHEYAPTPLHMLLAALPALRRKEGLPGASVLVTTNYDDSLERAFSAAGEAYDVMTYIADGPDAGRYMHRPFERPSHVIEVPNEYHDFDFEHRSVIIKVHGAIDRDNADEDSYVITEDDYIAYLARADFTGMLPKTLLAQLMRRHFLFLGYRLRDWNLRAILHWIWTNQRRRYYSWAIQLRPDELDIAFWDDRDVDIHDVSLDDYVDELAERLGIDLDPAPVADAA
jgi:SIR2-like protein